MGCFDAQSLSYWEGLGFRDLGLVPLKGTVRVLYGYYKGVLRILVAEFIRPKKVLSALNCLGFGVPYFKTFFLKEPL